MRARAYGDGPVFSLLPLLLGGTVLVAPVAAKAEGWADAALSTLQDRIAADVIAGRPLVVQAHVALCSNETIRCGGRGLGDGDSLARNLYWATTGGTRGWFNRRGSGWREVGLDEAERAAILHATPGVLDVRVWRREVVAGGPAFAKRGVRRAIPIYVVAFAWRGAAIDHAVNAYAADLFGVERRGIRLADGNEIAAGGAAAIVAYVGHSRWMDYVAPYRWPAEPPAGTPVKGTVVVACMTKQYVAHAVASPRRVPLLFTRDFVFAGTMPLDGAVQALAAGASLERIRHEAVLAYAVEEKKPPARVASVFTNPTDRRW